MTTIDTTQAATAATATPTAAKPAGFAADSTMFLKLLTEQLKNQDPMKPQDSSEFMAQLSQMTMVEKITALSTGQQQSNALALLGKTVTYLDEAGAVQAGKVESVDVTGPSLQLEGAGRIKPEKVQTVVTDAATAA